jgi:hypothetical protein
VLLLPKPGALQRQGARPHHHLRDPPDGFHAAHLDGVRLEWPLEEVPRRLTLRVVTDQPAACLPLSGAALDGDEEAQRRGASPPLLTRLPPTSLSMDKGVINS